MRQPYTFWQKSGEAAALLILSGVLLTLYTQWEQIPARVPLHFDVRGEIDRWGGKNSLLLLPATAVFIYLLLTVTSFFPGLWNIPVKLTDANRPAVYACMRNLQIVMKIEVIALLGFLTLRAAQAKALPGVFLPLLLLILLGTVGVFFLRLHRLGKLN